jgi:hypothetical protein
MIKNNLSKSRKEMQREEREANAGLRPMFYRSMCSQDLLHKIGCKFLDNHQTRRSRYNCKSIFLDKMAILGTETGENFFP